VCIQYLQSLSIILHSSSLPYICLDIFIGQTIGLFSRGHELTETLTRHIATTQKEIWKKSSFHSCCRIVVLLVVCRYCFSGCSSREGTASTSHCIFVSTLFQYILQPTAIIISNKIINIIVIDDENNQT